MYVAMNQSQSLVSLYLLLRFLRISPTGFRFCSYASKQVLAL